jgi:hypothetical protein
VILVVAALLVGAVVGLASGGSFRGLAEAHFRWWFLAFAGLFLQLVPISRDWPHAAGLGVALVISSYALLLVFVAGNVRRPGLALMGLGLLLNGVVIAANGGMPVSAAAVRGASGASSYAVEVRKLAQEGGAKHHLAGPDDVLLPLSDRVGVGAPIEGVFSIGDLFWVLGGAWAVAGLMRRPRRTGTSGPPRDERVVALPDSPTLRGPAAPSGPRRRRPPPGS